MFAGRRGVSSQESGKLVKNSAGFDRSRSRCQGLGIRVRQQAMSRRSKSAGGKASRTTGSAVEITRSPSLIASAGFILRPYQQRWAKEPARFAIAVKSAQIGYSTATAGWAVDRCLNIPRRNIIFSRARSARRKGKDFVDAFRGVGADWAPKRGFRRHFRPAARSPLRQRFAHHRAPGGVLSDRLPT